jgi:hypothetical protein
MWPDRPASGYGGTMIEAIMVVPRDGTPQNQHAKLAKSIGIADLEVSRTYLIEVSQRLSALELSALGQWLADPVLESAQVLDEDVIKNLADSERHQVWVGFKRGVVDNESDSILRICRLLGTAATGAKVLTLYLSKDASLERRVQMHLFTSSVASSDFAHLPYLYERVLRPHGVGRYLKRGRPSR